MHVPDVLASTKALTRYRMCYCLQVRSLQEDLYRAVLTAYFRASSVNTIIAGTTLMVNYYFRQTTRLIFFQGIGSGPQQLAFAGANEIVPKKARGQTLAFLNLAALPGSAFGSVIGS